MTISVVFCSKRVRDTLFFLNCIVTRGTEGDCRVKRTKPNCRKNGIKKVFHIYCVFVQSNKCMHAQLALCKFSANSTWANAPSVKDTTNYFTPKKQSEFSEKKCLRMRVLCSLCSQCNFAFKVNGMKDIIIK